MAGSVTNPVRADPGAAFIKPARAGDGIRMYGATSGRVGLKPAAAAGATDYTLPAADGVGVWLSDGAGNLTIETGAQTITRLGLGTPVSSLNGLTGALTLAVGTAGTDFTITPLGSIITFDLPSASATARGVMTTGTQTLAGAKTFTGAITASNLSGTNTGDTPPGGTGTEIQYRSGNSFGPVANSSYNGSTVVIDSLTVTTLNFTGVAQVINTTTVAVSDSLFSLAVGNIADTIDAGWYATYVAAGTKYRGMFFDSSVGKFAMFTGLQVEPTTTVNVAGTGYTVGTLVANLEGNVTGNVTGAVNGITLTTGGGTTTFLNANGLYSAVAYSSLTGTPSTFAPSVHASSHMSAGADPIRLDELKAPTDITTLDVSITLHGLVPKAPNDVAKYLSGLGTWVTLTGVTAHSALTGLTTGDDHTQYALLAGRATPQTLAFGTASGATAGYLTSTSHATKGKYSLNAAGTIVVDELNVRLGLGVTPLTMLHLATGADSIGICTLEQVSTINTDSFDLNFHRARGTVAVPTIITTGDVLGTINAYGYSGVGGYVNAAQIRFAATATVATTRVPGRITLATGTNNTPSVMTDVIIINGLQRVGIGIEPEVKLEVNGLIRTTAVAEFTHVFPTLGSGFEMRCSTDYATIGGSGVASVFLSYDRGGAAYADVWFRGKNIVFENNGVNAVLLSAAGFVGINKFTSIGAQLHIVSSNSTTIGQIIAGATSHSVALLQLNMGATPSGNVFEINTSGATGGNAFRTTIAGVSAVRQGLVTTGVVAKVGGKIFDYAADVSVGGAEADIFTSTLAANALGTNNDTVTASYGGTFVTVGTELTQLKVYFAGTAIWDSTAIAVATGTTSWRVTVELIRVSATVVRYTVALNTTGDSGFVYCSTGELTGLTLSNTNILKITGISSGVGSGTGDIVGKQGSVFWFPAA